MLAFAGCARQVALDPARPDAVPTELRLEAPVTPLAGMVTMPRAAWGPFTQACKTRIITVSGPPVPVPDQVSQACARVQGDIRPDGSARITLSPPRLSPEQLATPSLCRGWTVRDVGAHLAMSQARFREILVPLAAPNLQSLSAVL